MSLFGGNTCTWVLILVIVYLLTSQDNDCGCEKRSGCSGNCPAFSDYNCGCGCN